MSYRHEMSDLAHHLGLLLVNGGQVPAADLPAALGAHAAVVHLLREVHRGLTQAVGGLIELNVSEAERNPVALLGRLLRYSPTITDFPVSDTLAARAQSVAGEHWRAITRAATLAQHHWQDSLPNSRPLADAAWSEIADVAAVAECLTVLRGDLADSLVRTGRRSDAALMRRASESGLRLVARQVSRVAGTGPLPPADDLVPRPPDRVLVVLTPDALPEAFRRLSGMLASVQDLSPADVARIATVTAHGAVAAARAFAAAGDPFGSEVLLRHAERLIPVTRGPRRVAALTPGEQLPVAQAQQIYGYLQSLDRRGQVLMTVQASAFARRVPEVTIALSRAAHDQVRRGKWFAPAEGYGPGRPDWAVIATLAREPQMLEVLRAAALQAGQATRDWIPSPTPVPPGPAPRESLPPALATRSPPPRLAHPG